MGARDLYGGGMFIVGGVVSTVRASRRTRVPDGARAPITTKAHLRGRHRQAEHEGAVVEVEVASMGSGQAPGYG